MTRLQDSAFAPANVPFAQPVDAGPWRLTVIDGQLGAAAYSTIVATNEGNEQAPEGLAWALAYLTAENTSDQTRVINLSDFAATGTDGVLRRPPAMDCPEPALQATVEPAGIVEGWIPFHVNDTGNVILSFSSPFLGGSWSQAWMALTDGATTPAFSPAPGDSGLGQTPDAPAAFGETVRAGNFDVTLLEQAFGQAVYDMAEFGLRALAGSSGYDTWMAVKVRATNISDRPAFFSYTALQLAAFDGEAWDNIMALTAPPPDAAKELLPGATREGWAAFELTPWSALELIRIQPSLVADEPRFVSFGATPAAASSDTPVQEQQFSPGDQVVLTDDRINMRAAASTSGEIVVELPVDTALTITGEAITADSYTWYPVEVQESGQAGYVVTDYLALAGNE
jgi:hypothetical protein